jgi:hypothetical protein
VKITPAGRAAAKKPLDPIWAYAVELARRERPSVVPHIVSIATLRSAQQEIFLDLKIFGYYPWKIFGDIHSDHITELKALYVYEKARASLETDEELNAWCNRHILSRRAMEAVIKARDQTVQQTGGSRDCYEKLDPSACTNIRWVLARSFFRHTAFAEKDSDLLQYRTVHKNVPGVLHMYSSLHRSRPKWIIYDKHDIGGHNATLSFGTAIDPAWIQVGFPLTRFPC